MLTDKQRNELDKKLDPSHVRQRSQSGFTLDYIEGWHAIAEANRIFGHAEWSSETIELIENCPATKNEKGNIMVSFRAKVKVAVNGCVREGVGFGSGISKDIHAAYESAIKEAETDARKRALMTFGNPFGLALYDKDRKNVGVDEPPQLYNELNECLDHGALNEFIEKYEKEIESDTVISHLVNQRANEIEAGRAQRWEYRFYGGTAEAVDWCAKAFPKLQSINKLDELMQWHSDNLHIIMSLKILDKAEKYKRDGKAPKQRLEELVKSKMTQLSQEPSQEAAE